MLNKQVLYVARAGLPVDATGIRISRIGNLFEKLGYNVHYVCEKRIDSTLLYESGDLIREKDLETWMNKEEVHFRRDNKVYSYLPAFSGKKRDAIRDTAEIVTAHAAFKRLKEYCAKESPEIIILYNDVYALTKKLIPFCKKRGIKLMADVTEWYENRKDATIPERILIYLTDCRIRKLDKRVDGVIAVSKYFYNYYQKSRANCLWIPPLMSMEDNIEVERHSNTQNRVINFVYAGSPGSKDILLPFLRAIQKGNENGLRFRLDLIGVSEDALREKGVFGELPRIGIFVHGRKSHKETVEIVKKSDFGILFRYNKRYAKAGYSTKFAECMSLGVAMICNQIGGTESCIQSWENGIITNSYDENELVCLLERIWQMEDDEIIEMRKCAQQTAKQTYDASQYVYKLQSFIDTCVK